MMNSLFIKKLEKKFLMAKKMNQTENLIMLTESTSSSTPPPSYPNADDSNRTNQIYYPNSVFSISSNQNAQTLFQNTRTPQNHQQMISNQSGIPAIDLNHLPLSMRRNFNIQNNYPTGFIIFHSLSLLFIAFLMIAAEMVILIDSSNKDINNQIGGEIFKNQFFFIKTILKVDFILEDF